MVPVLAADTLLANGGRGFGLRTDYRLPEQAHRRDVRVYRAVAGLRLRRRGIPVPAPAFLNGAAAAIFFSRSAF